MKHMNQLCGSGSRAKEVYNRFCAILETSMYANSTGWFAFFRLFSTISICKGIIKIRILIGWDWKNKVFWDFNKFFFFFWKESLIKYNNTFSFIKGIIQSKSRVDKHLNKKIYSRRHHRITEKKTHKLTISQCNFT